MSAHDPFDGIYDDQTSGPGSTGPQVEAPTSEAQAAPQPPIPAQPAAGERAQESKQQQTYSLAFLRRQDKDDLQQIARDRGLDASGTRDALISRIATAQATR